MAARAGSHQISAVATSARPTLLEDRDPVLGARGALERRPIPPARSAAASYVLCRKACTAAAGSASPAHRIVGEQELSQPHCRKQAGRRARPRTRRLGIGVGVKGRALEGARSSWPEAAAPDFVRIGLARHPVREIRHAARMLRSPTAGEARHRQIETPPEEMRRAGLAEEGAAKPLQRHVGDQKDSPEAAGRFLAGIPRARVSSGNGIGVGDLDRHRPDADVNTQSRQPCEKLGVEIRNGLRASGISSRPPSLAAITTGGR